MCEYVPSTKAQNKNDNDDVQNQKEHSFVS